MVNMLTRGYRNRLKLREGADPTERRENLTKEILRNSTPFPKPLGYKDIDEGMMEWSNTALDLSFEGEKLPTVALYTNQRFEEYMQNWEHTDNKKNFLMNFKTITRESNPQKGTMNGSITNIPGDRYYVMRRERIIDKNGQESFMEFKMKQPFAVDLVYKISVVTTKYELLNTFNTKLQKIFKAGYNYLNINGHYVYIKLEDSSDDSEYAIDDRRYFAQVAKFTVKAYIIEEDDFIVEEKPVVKFKCFEGEQKNNEMEVFSEEDALVEEEGLYYKPLTITIRHGACDCPEFHARIPYNMKVKKTVLDNVRSFSITTDDGVKTNLNNFEFQAGERVNFRLNLQNRYNGATVTFYGYDMDTIYNENDLPESELDDPQIPEESDIMQNP